MNTSFILSVGEGTNKSVFEEGEVLIMLPPGEYQVQLKGQVVDEGENYNRFSGVYLGSNFYFDIHAETPLPENGRFDEGYGTSDQD